MQTMTARKQLKKSNQLPLPQRDDCKKENTKHCTTKQGPNTELPQIIRATIKNELTTTEPPSQNRQQQKLLEEGRTELVFMDIVRTETLSDLTPLRTCQFILVYSQ